MFRPESATAMASFFLEKAPGHTLNDLVLMKLMVLAEREFMAENTSLVTGARFASMQNGPVLSDVLDMIRGVRRAPVWEEHAQFVRWQKPGDADNHCVLTRPFPAEEVISEYEIDVLNAIWAKYGHMKKWDLVELTHEFPEWDSTYQTTKGSGPISLEAIYELSLKTSAEEAKARAEQIKYFERVFA